MSYKELLFDWVQNMDENAQKDVLLAENYYSLSEKTFLQSFFWLNSWKKIYQKEKWQIHMGYSAVFQVYRRNGSGNYCSKRFYRKTAPVL